MLYFVVDLYIWREKLLSVNIFAANHENNISCCVLFSKQLFNMILAMCLNIWKYINFTDLKLR